MVGKEVQVNDMNLLGFTIHSVVSSAYHALMWKHLK